jgi:hypothetical protein
MRRLGRAFLYLSAILWTVTLLSPFVSPAWAEVDGNCEATIKGVDVRGRSSTNAGDAIDVDDNEVVTVAMTSSAGFASHKIDLEIAGVRRTVSSKTDDGDTQWSGSVNVKDYAWAGAGLYKVIGSATLSDGTSCSGAALIDVKRNPLTTVAGGAAAATTAVGGVAVGASTALTSLQGIRNGRKVEEMIMDEVANVEAGPREPAPPEKPEGPISHFAATMETLDLFFGPFLRPVGMWPPPCFVLALPALLLTGAAMAVPGGTPTEPSGLRLPRMPWRPRITVAGILGGLLGGAGIVVLLQQYAVTPLARSLAIEGLVIGLVVGLVIPSLVNIWSVMHVNGVIARGERRLNEALAQAGPPSGGGQAPPAEHQP